MKKFTLLVAMTLATLTLYCQTTTCNTTTIYATTGSNAVCFDDAMYTNTVRGCFSNCYPDAAYTSFTFGSGAASASVTEEDVALYMCINPQPGSYFIPTRTTKTAGSTNNPLTCPGINFGVMTNGIYISPTSGNFYEENGVEYEDWEQAALNATLGWDENDAHKQSSGRYHYHGDPSSYATHLGYSSAQHSGIIGWAADGYPIYYKYGYTDPNDATSAIKELTSCWGLRSGDRSTLGFAVYPSGSFDGTYSADYQYPAIGVSASSCDLDSANGRWAKTPEFPNGTYHYVITANWPKTPRYFKGTPDGSFYTGPGNCSNTSVDTDCSSTAYDASVHLPVELVFFKGTPQEGYNEIIWQTATEKSSSHFEIERSIDGTTFERLDIVESNHYTQRTQDYSFLDFDLTESVYYYRLKMVDYDGSFEYSDLINVVNGQSKANIGEFQPNIVKYQSQVSIQLTESANVKLQIINAFGQVVHYEEKDLNAGYHSWELDFQNLSAQVYYVAIQVDGKVITRKIVKE